MNSEERFRKSLEELINSKAFPFDEANWDKARGMIDAAKKPRRIAPLILGGVLLLGTIITGAYFLSESSVGTTEKLALNSTTETQQMVERTESAALPKTEVSAPVIPSQKPSSVKPAGEKPATSSPEKITPPEILAANTNPAAPVTVVKRPKTDVSIEPNKPVKTQNNLPLTKTKETTAPALVKEEIKPVVSVTPAKEEAPVEPNDKKDDAVSEPAKNTAAPVVINTDSKTPSEPVTPAKETEPVNVAVNNNTPANTINTPEQQTTGKDESYAPIRSNSANTENKETPKQSIVLNDLVNSANPEELPADNDRGELGRPKDYPVLFSVEAGASYLYGWQNPGTRDASGFSPVIGVNYFNNFKPKMSLTFGIQYTSIGNLDYSTYTSRISRFGFGEESKVTVFTPVKVHYLVVPLRFNYSLDVMNSIGIGCNISYLLNVESEIETYTEKLDRKYDLTLSKTTGYTEGFKKYDTQVSAFYKRRLYPNLALNLELFYGFTDIKDNKFFNSNVFERNTGLKLTLVYNFLKK